VTANGFLFQEQQGELRAFRGQERLEDVVNIDLRSDVRLFTLMAALNAAGFNFEVPTKEMSGVRLAVREELKKAPREILLQLRVFYTTHAFRYETAAHTAYTSLALMLSGPPEFRFRSDTPKIPSDVERIVGFEELMSTFYQEAGIAEMWERYRAKYDDELIRYRPVVKSVIQQTLQYLRIPARIVLDRKIVLMPDQLGYQDVVNARNLEKVYYIVVGPSDDPASNYVELQHEYLHLLIDPLVEKYGGTLIQTKELIALAHEQPEIGSDFRDRYLLIVGESLIEAILGRLHPPDDVERRQLELFRRGLVFVPYLWRSLEAYEQSPESSLPSYLEQVFQNITAAEIEKDAEIIAANEQRFLEQEEARKVELAEAEAEWERENTLRTLLNESGQLIAEKRYAEAEAKLGALLEMDPESPNASFYLAQIAAQQGRHRDANGFYLKVEQSEIAEPWLRAISKIRIGRFLAFQGDYSAARVKFEEVLQIEGDLKGARREAEELLDQLPESH
jgi:hypothetical protein